MIILPVDQELLMFLKLFTVFTCFAYWVRRILRRTIRGQQPHFYHDSRA